MISWSDDNWAVHAIAFWLQSGPGSRSEGSFVIGHQMGFQHPKEFQFKACSKPTSEVDILHCRDEKASDPQKASKDSQIVIFKLSNVTQRLKRMS
jgi:hypothetical protein